MATILGPNQLSRRRNWDIRTRGVVVGLPETPEPNLKGEAFHHPAFGKSSLEGKKKELKGAEQLLAEWRGLVDAGPAGRADRRGQGQQIHRAKRSQRTSPLLWVSRESPSNETLFDYCRHFYCNSYCTPLHSNSRQEKKEVLKPLLSRMNKQGVSVLCVLTLRW